MRKCISLMASLAFAAFLPFAALAQHHAHQFSKAKDLKWSDTPSLPGAKLAVIEGPINEAKPFIMRIRFPSGYKIAPHYHSAIEHVTVIKGVFAMGVSEKADESKLTKLEAGDVGIMQPNTPHFAMAIGETEVQVHGVGPWTLTYVNPADDPRKKK